MGAIDPTARVDSKAAVGADVQIGPYCVVGPDVVLGEGCRLLAHVYIAGHTSIGAGTVIAPFASLGTPPQSVKYRGGATRLVIGAACDIREGVTMNTGTEDDRGETRVGDRCLFMVDSHVGHDCVVGNDVIFANNATLGGHVVVGDSVFFGGEAAIHQHVRIGEGAMIAGVSAITMDVIPFGVGLGVPASLVGLNIVGLRRRGVARADMHCLRRAYRALFLGAGSFADRVERVAREHEGDPLVGKVIGFIRARGRRPLMKVRPPRERDMFTTDTT